MAMFRQLRVFWCAGERENTGAEAFIRMLPTGHSLTIHGGFVAPYRYLVSLHNS